MEILLQYLKELRIAEISVRDLVDIGLISFVIYRILLLLKGTRAAKMATGIIFFALFYFFAKIAQLQTVQWFMTAFVTYAMFAIIIIYQSEIRKILASMGSTRVFGRFFGKEVEIHIEDVVLAAVAMSSRRIGALMVIERQMGLKSYMENGHTLNARLSYDLLVTIFQPETPLHDGAVIIQKDMIAAASCFLPLTLEPHLSKEYGTRHRAAIGITEETDALAVVVSEETGRMSVAIGGKLKRFADAESLQAFIEAQLNPAEEKLRFSPLRWRPRKEPKA